MDWTELYFTYWMWFIIALVLLGLELAVPGVFFLWIGLAAATTGLLVAALAPSVTLQLWIFGVLSVAAVLISRRYFRRTEQASDEPNLNQRGRSYIGREFTVVTAIQNGVGKVKIGDTLWRVEGPDTAEGSKVRVVDARGTVLTVAPAQDPHTHNA